MSISHIACVAGGQKRARFMVFTKLFTIKIFVVFYLVCNLHIQCQLEVGTLM